MDDVLSELLEVACSCDHGDHHTLITRNGRCWLVPCTLCSCPGSFRGKPLMSSADHRNAYLGRVNGTDAHDVPVVA